MKQKAKIIGAAGALTLGVLGGVFVWGAYAPISAASQVEQVVEGNVFIEGADVSGLTKEEADQVVEENVKELGNRKVTFIAGKKEISVKAKKLGLCAANDDAAKQAVAYGNSGNILERWRDRQDIKNGKQKEFSVIYSVDPEKVQNFLALHEKELVNVPKNASLRREDGKFVFVPGEAGTKIRLEESAQKVIEYMEKEFGRGDSGKVELVVDEEQPHGKEEDLKEIKDELGSFSTDFSSSSAARATNVRNGASKINGTVLYPGETFSVAAALNPMTAENGYQPAPSYENGTTVMTYGGGICQVSTTLYNAVIRAELEVVERSAHSMSVHYVQPSMDAAIAGDSKDFKFRNNKDYPVYIEGYTDGGTLHFSVFGKEDRPSNRTVEFESETLQTIAPKPRYEASGAAIGSIVCTSGSTHTGYVAQLWKIVKEDGKEVSRDVFNKSSYRATGATYAVGTASSSAAASASVKRAIASQDLGTIRAAISGASSVAAKEKADTQEGQKKEDSGKQQAENSSKKQEKADGQASGGTSGDSGKSEKAGNSGNTGNSGKSEKSGNTGDAGNSGKSDNTGNAGNTGNSGKSGNTGNSGKSGSEQSAQEPAAPPAEKSETKPAEPSAPAENTANENKNTGSGKDTGKNTQAADPQPAEAAEE